MSTTAFRRALADAMREARCSQSGLARSADVHESHICRLLAGSRAPTREVIDKLSAGLGMDDDGHHRLLIAAGFLPEEADIRDDLCLLTTLPTPMRDLVREMMTALAAGPYGKDQAA